jgi:hypothetical protein
MTAIEIKYSLFHDIDSINDESLLYKLSALVKGMLLMPKAEEHIPEDTLAIPDFVRNMSVKSDIPVNVNTKDLIHMYWNEKYGKGLS